MTIPFRQNFLSSFLLILLIVSGVEARHLILDQDKSTSDYQLTVPVERGWNLLMGFAGPEQIAQDSPLTSEDIKAIYALLPGNNYARLFPDPEPQQIEPYTAQWVLIKKAGNIRYTVSGVPTLETGFGLNKGWNFVGLSPEFMDEFLGVAAYQGTCDIDRSYIYNYVQQRWDLFHLSTKLDHTGTEVGSIPVGTGIVVRVVEDCILGEEALGTAPPNLPSEVAPGGSCCVVETGAFAFFRPITKQECESLGKEKAMNVQFVDSLSKEACKGVTAIPTCSDSDDSVDYNSVQFAMYDDLFTRGYVRVSSGTSNPDRCIDDKTLEEGFCMKNGREAFMTVPCSLGCTDGACVR